MVFWMSASVSFIKTNPALAGGADYFGKADLKFLAIFAHLIEKLDGEPNDYLSVAVALCLPVLIAARCHRPRPNLKSLAYSSIAHLIISEREHLSSAAISVIMPIVVGSSATVIRPVYGTSPARLASAAASAALILP